MKLILLFLLVPLLAFSQVTEKPINNLNWQFRKKGDKEWLQATVPGTVHTDLLENKIIADPFYGDNEKQLQWIENESWEYKTSFEISKKEFSQQHIELQFDGLDTYANVYLNDSLILSADNMFRTWNIDVKKTIHFGENRLKVIFYSAVKKGKEEAAKLKYTLPGDEKVFTRKAQYQYGWDWGPRFVTSGIYKGVKLIFWKNVKLINVKYSLISINDKQAELEFRCKIKSDVDGQFTLDAIRNLPELAGNIAISSSQQNIQLKKGMNTCVVTHTIKNPQRWWSNGLGTPFLYPFSIKLSGDGNEMDIQKLNVGLRTIELVQKKDTIGTSFYFKLNGVPVFMKGANYIPPDNFLPRVTTDNYEKIIQNAVDANMNMLRVWGGGVYADDEFYNECDKHGILVWQDFMFACAMYPGDEHFIKNVSEEIKQQVVRLRNHASLALWCGNNEIDEGWKNWGWQKQYKYSPVDSAKIAIDDSTLFQSTIPSIISKNDSLHAYWPSSPSIGWGHKESLLQGDSHYWGVWWGMEPFEIYKEKVGRFMTEYGFQGMPYYRTFNKMGLVNNGRVKRKGVNIGDEQLFNLYLQRSPIYDSLTERKAGIDSAILLAHQKHPTGYQTINEYLQRDYIVPKDFENYIYVSQLLQAEGMKTAIEAHRRAKPYCMGTLYWQLNDCWPVTSWSSIDYYGNWKALHYQVKRSYENCIVSINEEENQLKVFIVNDELKEGKGILDMKLIDFNGNIIWLKKMNIVITSNSSKVYFSIDKKEFGNYDLKQIVFNAKVVISNSKTAYSNYYFSKPKDLVLKKPEIKMVPVENEDAVELSTNTVAKDVFLFSKEDGVNLMDNYFDLLPNETKRIYYKRKTIRVANLPYSNSPVVPVPVPVPFSVKSLYDTFHE